jgi:hypothetical protein
MILVNRDFHRALRGANMPKAAKDKEAEKEKPPGFWQNVPAVLTAFGGVIAALTGLIVGLNKAGCFERADKVVVASTPKPPAPLTTGPLPPSEDLPKPAPPTPLPNPAPPVHVPKPPASPAIVYPVDLAITTQAKAADHDFKILSAQLDHHSGSLSGADEQLELHFKIRVTKNDVSTGTGYFSDSGFRLLIDDDSIAPFKCPNENVSVNSSKTGEVVFLIPATAAKATLRVGYTQNKTTDIPISLKRPAQP